MLKKIAIAGALAAASFSGSAQAAVATSLTGGAIISNPTGPNETYGTFDFAVNDINDGNQAFSITYTFTNIFNPAAAAATATFTTVDGDRIDFTNAFINGGGAVSIMNQPSGNPGSTIFVFNSPIPQGPGTLTLQGNLRPNGNGAAVVSGNLTLSAVPEPTTWALFILGFGAIGHTMRRRSNQVRVAKASLRFA